MKIDVISDIHNNLLALNRDLEYLEDSGCEKIICCGDIISIGPLPEETVRRIMGVENLLCVRENHEDYLGKLGNGESLTMDMSENQASFHEWEFERLSDECKRFIDSLPVSRLEEINRVKIYVTNNPMAGKVYMNSVRDLTLQKCEQMFSNINVTSFCSVIAINLKHQHSLY